MQIISFFEVLLTIVLIYMMLSYAVARLSHRYDVVDSAWGIGFVLVAWMSLVLQNNFGSVQVISALLVTAWGLRLFAHIAHRNWRKASDDHRYEAMKQKWGSASGRKMFINVFMLQGLLLIVVSLPMIAVAFGPPHIHIMSYIGWAIWLFGILFETLADRQLATFIAHRIAGTHAIMKTGLWRYSRHPNYFGEVMTWWGAAVVAISLGQWWGLLGAVAITILITKVSGIPPLERHYDGNTEYEAYRQRTSVLVPLPLRSRSS